MEVFGKINAAEADAKRLIADASRNALTAREQATEYGRAAVEKAKTDARAEVEAILKSAETSAAKDAEALSRSTDNKRAVLRDNVESRLEAAVEFIVSSVR
jgi:vacuolar-type H+-ATPase subunit H